MSAGEERGRARRDLGWVAAATLASYALASLLELRERLWEHLAVFERWQADELPFVVTVFACGLAWYAWRRRREAQRQLALRVRAEAHIAELLGHKRELAQQLIALQESERRALARELHDELGQSCAAIRVETAWLRHHVGDDRAAMLAAAERADAAALGLYRLVRDMLQRLRPAHLDELGLATALQSLCEAWEARSGLPCTFVADGRLDRLGDPINITIYRVVQEALTNVLRHAQARGVRVALACTPPEARLSIVDDGRGMDPGAVTRGLGLLGAVERAAAVGGVLDVRSAPGAGVRIELRVPVPAT